LTGVATDGQATYNAPDTAQSVSLQLEVLDGPSKGTLVTSNISIVAPSSAYMVQEPGTGIRHTMGVSGVGFKGRIYMEPRNVSFNRLQFREGTVNGTGTGFYSFLNNKSHDLGDWADIGSCALVTGCHVLGVDMIDTGDKLGPYSNGTFTWPIPWQYRVGVGAAQSFTTGTHLQHINGAGTTDIQKAGAGPFTKLLNDPTSNF
jgi:hypothetical protein